MTQQDRRKFLQATIEALDGAVCRPVKDGHVAAAADLSPLVQINFATLQHGIGLDPDQREELGRMAEILDRARAKYATLRPRQGGGLVAQHHIEASRESTLLGVAEMLDSALRTAADAGVELRITVGQVWSSFVDHDVLRVILRTVPAKRAHRPAA